MISLPMGEFGAVLADIPWRFITFSGKKSVPSRTEVDPYPTMALAELKQLPVAESCAKDCALFMWIVGSHLDQALDLGRSWGFKYTTDAFVWLKDPDDYYQRNLIEMEPKFNISMGYWTRKQSETCLLFTRGKPRRLSKGVRQVIAYPRREHSRKPDEQYERIERLVGGPYLEMFGRQQRAGWTVWGNETDKFEAAE